MFPAITPHISINVKTHKYGFETLVKVSGLIILRKVRAIPKNTAVAIEDPIIAAFFLLWSTTDPNQIPPRAVRTNQIPPRVEVETTDLVWRYIQKVKANQTKVLVTETSRVTPSNF